MGACFILITTLIQPFYSISQWLSDQLFVTAAPSPNIVVIGIDDDTLASYGKWSQWSRSLHAKAINNLKAAGARVIAYDVLFVDSSSDDQLLATSIANSGNVILASAGIEPLPRAPDGVTYNRTLSPIAPLEQAISGTGHANIVPDPDGKVRRLPLVVKDRAGHHYPALSIVTLHTLFSRTLPTEYSLQGTSFRILERDIPVDASYQMRVNFEASAESRPYISYGKVIRGEFDPGIVKNKIVLIGTTATGSGDAWPVPGSRSEIPGVFIHAAAMDTILRQRFLTEADTNITMIIMALMVCITALTLPRFRLWLGAAIAGGLFIAYLIACFLAFDRGYILNILYPVSTLPIIYISSVICQIIIAQSDRQFVKNLFGRYISPQVARELLNLANAGNLQLGGELRQVTVLFADIRNFTPMCETMGPEAIVNMLNKYLTVIIDSVVENDGMVNKFAGDNIMAVWNAPRIESQHARLAVKAAGEARQRLNDLRQLDPSLPRVTFGIGINTGEALAGNVGSEGRTEYTVIGDTVNLAARICGGTPGGEIWIGPETYKQAKEHIQADEMAPQSFKGKAELVVVYRVTGWK